MSVTAVSRIVFLVGMLGDEMRLLAIGSKSLFCLLDDELGNSSVGTCPTRILAGFRQFLQGIPTIEPAPFTFGEIVFPFHLRDANRIRALRVSGLAETIRNLARSPVSRQVCHTSGNRSCRNLPVVNSPWRKQSPAVNPHFSSGGVTIAQDFRPQRVLAPESVVVTTFEGACAR